MPSVMEGWGEKLGGGVHGIHIYLGETSVDEITTERRVIDDPFKLEGA